jgi:hypothetical protein
LYFSLEQGNLDMETIPLTFVPLLQKRFNWNLARAKCVAALIIALIKMRTVNLVQLAVCLQGNALKESKYRRLQRLFDQLTIDFACVALFIACQISQSKYTLVMDRTNWEYGGTHINILFLAIVYKGIAIPILWVMLDKDKKGGNSNTAERIALVESFINIFGVESIESLLADREFIGKKWMSYLVEKHIEFRIRIKHNVKISRINKGSSPARNFFRQLACGEAVQLIGKRKIFGLTLCITGLRLPGGEYLIIISNDSASCEQVLNDYGKRWEIETLFKALKSQGFDFETSHMVDPKKVEKLIAFLAIAFLWAHNTGEWLHEQKPITIKTHKRKSISIFRYGLDYLRGILLNIHEKKHQLQNVLALFQKRLNCIAPPLT